MVGFHKRARLSCVTSVTNSCDVNYSVCLSIRFVSYIEQLWKTTYQHSFHINILFKQTLFTEKWCKAQIPKEEKLEKRWPDTGQSNPLNKRRKRGEEMPCSRRHVG